MNDEIRKPNDEGNNTLVPYAHRMADRVLALSFGFGVWTFLRGFGFRHCFGIWSFGIFFLLADASCDKPATPPPAAPTIASLVPAATDLIVGMGARDRLVAVSTYDGPEFAKLPKAGDQNIDWEVLRATHPSVLVMEQAPDRVPAGVTANAADRHIMLLNLQIETLDDIFTATDKLGDALKEPQLAAAAHQQLHDRLEKVRARFAGLPPVRTLVVISPTADGVVGTGTFIDDLLKIAGGVNVLSPSDGHWPTIDREKLLSLSPEVILQLLPDAPPQEREQATAVWKQLRQQIPAVAAGRVYPTYEHYALLPGWHVADLAETFAKALHPQRPTSAATAQVN